MDPHAARGERRGLTARNLTARAVGAPTEHGFSLVEVLAASAILLGVMLSIMTMFIYGGQHINSGKLLTKATSIASDVQEQFRKFGLVQCYQVLNDAGDPTVDTHYTWNSDTNAPDYPTGAEYQAILDDWGAQAADGLPQGTMTITVRGLSELAASPDEIAFNDAYLIQIVVTVRWKERRRLRSVVFETVRT